MSPSVDYYGRVDGPRPENVLEAINSDPFESLLGFCRVLGIHYEVKQNVPGGTWTATLEPIGHWPADFYQYSGERDNRKAKFTAVGHNDRLDALRVAFCLVFHSLFDSCHRWRDIVSHQEAYKSWFPIETARREAERQAYEQEQAEIAAAKEQLREATT